MSAGLYTYTINSTKVDLARVDDAYTQCISVPVDTLVRSLALRFSSRDVLLKITIDGKTIADFDLDNYIGLLPSEWDTGIQKAMIGNPGLYVNDGRNVIVWRPEEPYRVSTSMVVEAKANNNSNGRDFLGYVLEAR